MMKFLFFFALSALLGAAYAIYAPEAPAKIAPKETRSNDIDIYTQEVSALDSKMRVASSKLSNQEKQIQTLRKELQSAYQEVKNKTPQLARAHDDEIWDDKFPENSPLVSQSTRHSNLMGVAGLQMRANKLRLYVKELEPLKQELNQIMDAKARASAKLKAAQAEEASSNKWFQ